MPRRRAPRARVERGASAVGSTYEVEVGPIAHGGHCVARLPDDGRVVFVRHALPGERVVVRITEGTEGDRFWRGDAVTVLTAAPGRVPAPCPYAGPDRCGGCDFQHVDPAHQRSLKAEVVREQLVRLGRLPATDPVVAGLTVEAVPGDDGGLHWRTRQRYVALPDGRLGMRKHRSHDVVPVSTCLLAGPAPSYSVFGRELSVAGDGFWQVHPGAPEALVDAVLTLLEPRPGERALDLYSGVGLFASFLATAVGPSGSVTAVEGDAEACRHARLNLGSGARISAGPVDRVLAAEYDEPFDLVVLDPPREGARARVVAQVADRTPRAIAYVACDPAALARDVASFAEHGYPLTRLRAFDLFPMTHHVECVALLERGHAG